MPDDASGRDLAEAAEWRPVTRSLTYQLVVEAVEAQILTGALKVGDHLPPERELASLLGTSRPAVREGLRMLEAQGVLRTVGAGSGSATVVTALPSEALTRLLRLHLALSSFRTTDVVEARVMLERRSAELAAQNGKPADFDRIRAALDRMDDPALPLEEFNELDTEFHVSLADASDNQLVADLQGAGEDLRFHRLDHELVGERAGHRPPFGGFRQVSTGCVVGHTVISLSMRS